MRFVVAEDGRECDSMLICQGECRLDVGRVL